MLLVGLMATGKSTVGRLVADRLGCDYVDNDALVDAAVGALLAPLLAERGTAALRSAESAAMRLALGYPAPMVAGIAAGVVEDATNRRLLAGVDALVVWLRARPETLAARVGDGGDRPWLWPDPLAAFTRMAVGRAAWYDEVSDLVVDVDDAEPERLADRIVRAARATRDPSATG